jgi:hypothetical protein
LANIINGTDTGSGGLITTGDSSDELQLQTAETTALTINSSQNVGIGTSSPDLKLSVAGAVNLRNSARAGAFEIDSSGNLYLGTATTAGAVIFETGHSTTGLPSTGTVRARIDSDGLKFGSDTAAANALDDYEEGTWTPTAFGETIAGTTTYSFQLGQYVKVGNMVTCTAGIGVTNMTGTGKVLFGNLPFTQSNTTMDAYSASIGKVSLLTFSNQLGLMPLANTTYIRVISISSGNSYSQVDVDTVFEFYYTITFFV